MCSANKEKKTKNKSKDKASKENGDGRNGGGRGVIADPRFASVHSDPRFQKLRRRETRVAIDARFNRIFTDKNFASSSTASLDKRGKRRKRKPEAALRQYYRMEEDEEEEHEKNKKSKKEQESDSEESGRADSSSESESESESGEEDEAEGSESSSESTTDGEDEDIVYEDDVAEVEEENVPMVEDATRRLAAVNLDWRHVRAIDIFVVLRSFLPKGGDILSVAVYPSEFGIKQMKEEDIHGPVGLFDDENWNNNNDDNEIDYEKLRAYEKSRLRYYFAVVECDSVSTAEHLYKACDGAEFERSSNVLDLRFIPDSMDFKHPPRDVATEAPASYEGLDFHTRALQHSKILISWDEDEPERVKKLRRNFNDDQLAELDLKEFFASDESETDDDGTEDKSEKKKDEVDKYRALIQSGDGSDGDGEEEYQDMEVTFNPGLEDLSKHILEKKNKKSESVWEEFLRKRHEKKKARRRKSEDLSGDETSDSDGAAAEEPDDFFVDEQSVEKVGKKDVRGKSGKRRRASQDADEEAEASRAELELLLADDKGIDNGIKGYNLKPKKVKGKKGKEVIEEDKIPTVNYDDPRFSALFTSPLFALDPTDPQFKRSAAYARQVAQKQRKEDRQESLKRELGNQHKKAQMRSDDPKTKGDEHGEPDALPSKKGKHELSSLIRSIKMKSQQVQLLSKGNTSKKQEMMPSRYTKEMEKPDVSTLVKSVKKKTKK